jgi:hypothetical protein
MQASNAIIRVWLVFADIFFSFAKLVFDEEEIRIYQCLGADQDTDTTHKR